MREGHRRASLRRSSQGGAEGQGCRGGQMQKGSEGRFCWAAPEQLWGIARAEVHMWEQRV